MHFLMLQKGIAFITMQQLVLLMLFKNSALKEYAYLTGMFITEMALNINFIRATMSYTFRSTDMKMENFSPKIKQEAVNSSEKVMESTTM